MLKAGNNGGIVPLNTDAINSVNKEDEKKTIPSLPTTSSASSTPTPPAHRQEKRPTWLALPPEIKEKIIQNMGLSTFSAYVCTSQDGYLQGMPQLPAMLTAFTQDLQKRTVTTDATTESIPDFEKIEKLAQSIVIFHNKLKTASVDPSSPLRQQEQRWELTTQKSVEKLAGQAQSVLDQVAKLKEETRSLVDQVNAMNAIAYRERRIRNRVFEAAMALI